MALLRSIFGCVSRSADDGGASCQRSQTEALDSSHSSSSDSINTTAVSGCGAVRATPPPLPLPPANYKPTCSSLFWISCSAVVAEQCVLEKYISRPKQTKEAVHYLSRAQGKTSRRVLFIEGRGSISKNHLASECVSGLQRKIEQTGDIPQLFRIKVNSLPFDLRLRHCLHTMQSCDNLRIRPIVLLENFSGRDSQYDQLVQEVVQKSLSLKGAVLLTSRERKPDWLRARTIHLHKPDADALLGMLRDLNVPEPCIKALLARTASNGGMSASHVLDVAAAARSAVEFNNQQNEDEGSIAAISCCERLVYGESAHEVALQSLSAEQLELAYLLSLLANTEAIPLQLIRALCQEAKLNKYKPIEHNISALLRVRALVASDHGADSSVCSMFEMRDRTCQYLLERQESEYRKMPVTVGSDGSGEKERRLQLLSHSLQNYWVAAEGGGRAVYQHNNSSSSSGADSAEDHLSQAYSLLAHAESVAELLANELVASGCSMPDELEESTNCVQGQNRRSCVVLSRRQSRSRSQSPSRSNFERLHPLIGLIQCIGVLWLYVDEPERALSSLRACLNVIGSADSLSPSFSSSSSCCKASVQASLRTLHCLSAVYAGLGSRSLQRRALSTAWALENASIEPSPAEALASCHNIMHSDTDEGDEIDGAKEMYEGGLRSCRHKGSAHRLQ